MALAIMMASGAMAQTVYNSSGSSCGVINSDGTVYSKSGSSIGRIYSDGTVNDRGGSKIGKIDRDGTFWDKGGSKIGWSRWCSIRKGQRRLSLPQQLNRPSRLLSLRLHRRLRLSPRRPSLRSPSPLSLKNRNLNPRQKPRNLLRLLSTMRRVSCRSQANRLARSPSMARFMARRQRRSTCRLAAIRSHVRMTLRSMNAVSCSLVARFKRSSSNNRKGIRKDAFSIIGRVYAARHTPHTSG